ncbi:MAG: hypothetical protein CM1200mP15_09150 [Dehalococcoidia bacterium]|nr:MAG: hypothetical protein CM1200mP15_09150 [Dehalococcoidia bacterium]
MTQQTESALTPEVKAMIGVSGEIVESWGVVDLEYSRRFTQAVMDLILCIGMRNMRNNQSMEN